MVDSAALWIKLSLRISEDMDSVYAEAKDTAAEAWHA